MPWYYNAPGVAPEPPRAARKPPRTYLAILLPHLRPIRQRWRQERMVTESIVRTAAMGNGAGPREAYRRVASEPDGTRSERSSTHAFNDARARWRRWWAGLSWVSGARVYAW
jgi:hypothetical protein